MAEEKHFFQDNVKVVLHVQTQKGWDNPTTFGFELVPLTRPYGLQPGMVFQAQTFHAASQLEPSHMVEVERYNPTPPKTLPPDEQITRRVKTTAGVATTTLTEPGWWCLAAERDGGQREHEGKMYPVKQRAILWVFVDEKP
jgi:cobalt/nickel transport protein